MGVCRQANREKLEVSLGNYSKGRKSSRNSSGDDHESGKLKLWANKKKCNSPNPFLFPVFVVFLKCCRRRRCANLNKDDLPDVL